MEEATGVFYVAPELKGGRFGQKQEETVKSRLPSHTGAVM